MDRRDFNLAVVAMSAVGLADTARGEGRDAGMFGLISQFMTVPAHRDEFVRILADATKGMPGCLSYVVALDATRDDTVWVTEVWADAESHSASLALPEVRDAMAKGRPLITGMGARITTRPVAGA